jgi:hypothetical protein
MRRHQLEQAIRTACQIIQRSEVIVVGSQAILGTYDESHLPAAATMSIEVDILPIADTNAETARLADLIEGVAGEFSSFEELPGFSIDGVDLDTAVLPEGWRDRLVKVQNANTAAPAGSPAFTGWCLDNEDLCVAKLIAFREKDLNFTDALLDDRLVDVEESYSASEPLPTSTKQQASEQIHGSGVANQADQARPGNALIWR